MVNRIYNTIEQAKKQQIYFFRFKSTPFKNEEALQKVKADVIRLNEETRPTAAIEQHKSPSASGGEGEVDVKKTGFWTHYKIAFQQEPSSDRTDPVEDIKNELRNYLMEPTLDAKHGENIAKYWAVSPYKNLKKVAHRFLCIPPSTVYSERLFSLAGNICDSKRNRLDPEKIKMLVFLNRNIN